MTNHFRIGLLTTMATLLIGAGQALATTHYAATNGQYYYWPCTSPSTPCDLITAIQGSHGVSPASGDQVIVEPGTYHYYDTTITAPVRETISSATNQPAPNIIGTITQPGPYNEPQMVLTMNGGHLYHVDVTVISEEAPAQAEGNAAVRSFGGTVYDRDIFTGIGPQTIGAYIGGNDQLLDSVANVNGTDDTGGEAVAITGASNTILRNVTAAAYGSGAAAILTETDNCAPTPPAIVSIVNTIAYAPNGTSVWAATGPSGDCTAHGYGSIFYQIGNSDWNPGSASLAPGSGITPDGPNINATPLFVNPLQSNFHEQAGSPTINKGTDDPHDGLFDPDYHWRDLGGAPDIGAYEWPAPYVETDGVTGVSSTGATLHGELDDEAANLSGTYYFQYGTSPNAMNNYVPIHQGTFAASASTPNLVGVSASMPGLPSTKYYYQLVGHDSDGGGEGAVASFTTPAKGVSAHSLALTVAGSGSIKGAGVDCGAVCTLSLTTGSSFSLTATANAGSTFIGWSGACTGTGACKGTLSGDESVTATFVRTPLNGLSHRLLLTFPGNGFGLVSGPGLRCEGECSAPFPDGTVYTLTATPRTGYVFTGWGGACSGTSTTCTVTVDSDMTVSATFASPTAHGHVRPKLSEVSLTGVKRHKPKLSFVVASGPGSALTSLSIHLPRYLKFRTVTHGLSISPRATATVLRDGVLTIRFATPVDSVLIGFTHRSLAVTRAKRRNGKLEVVAVETTGAATVLLHRI